MDLATALSLLISNLGKLAEFGAAIARARAENRPLTKEEVDASGVLAQGALDRLKAAIVAAEAQPPIA